MEVAMGQQSCHDHDTHESICGNPSDLNSDGSTDCCQSDCDCGALGCRTQPCSTNTHSFDMNGSGESFEAPQDNYAFSFPSGLYRPPSTLH